MKRTPLARVTRLRSRKRRTVGTADQREYFRLAVCPDHAVCACALINDGPCEGRLEAHHVVPQEWLRKNYRQFGPYMLANLLWDSRNGLPLCARHHRRHTLAMNRVPLSVLPPATCEFISEVGADYVVQRTYRTGVAA